MTLPGTKDLIFYRHIVVLQPPRYEQHTPFTAPRAYYFDALIMDILDRFSTLSSESSLGSADIPIRTPLATIG